MQTPDPTPEEIEAMCEEIQSGWSERERAKRGGRLLSPEWNVPILRDSEGDGGGNVTQVDQE